MNEERLAGGPVLVVVVADDEWSLAQPSKSLLT